MKQKHTQAIEKAHQEIISHQPNSYMQKWIGKNYNDVDWLGERGAILYYDHNDGAVCNFLKAQIPFLKAKKVKEIYTEWTAQEIRNARSVKQGKMQIRPEGREIILPRLSLIEALDKNNIALVPIFPEEKSSSPKRGTVPEDVWFKQRMMDTDPKVIESLKKRIREGFIIVGFFGPLHGRISIELGLAAFYINSTTSEHNFWKNLPKNTFHSCPPQFFKKLTGFHGEVKDPEAPKLISNYLETLTNHFLYLSIANPSKDHSKLIIFMLVVAVVAALLYKVLPEDFIQSASLKNN